MAERPVSRWVSSSVLRLPLVHLAFGVMSNHSLFGAFFLCHIGLFCHFQAMATEKIADPTKTKLAKRAIKKFENYDDEEFAFDALNTYVKVHELLQE